MLIAARNGFLAGKRLPYDAEVEYLESTGTQWIDTGVVPDFTTECRLRGGITRYVNGVNLLSARTGSNTRNRYMALSVSDTSQVRCVLNENTYFIAYTYNKTQHDIICNETNTHRYYFDGRLITTFRRGNDVQQNNPILMFGISGYEPERWLCHGILSLVQIVKGGVLVRDFISVRFTNELGVTEGAMYDRANPTVGMNPDGSARTDGLYRNRGTGTFVIGSDI